MKFFRPNASKISINITSLIDILFLIIIFFALTTRFDDEREKALSLPPGAGTGAANSPGRLEIVLDSGGVFRVDDRSFTAEGLAVFLEAYEGPRDRAPLLKVDEAIPHGSVISLIDLIEKSGFEKIAFATALR